MKIYKKYIVKKRFKQKGICGNLNLPFGTVCYTLNNIICCDKGEICSITSQNAYDYFSQNDDNLGVERAKLIDDIFQSLTSNLDNSYYHKKRWDLIWKDSICFKYKRKDYNDFWIWNYEFYNAPIYDLQYIAKLIDIKERV